MTYHKVFRCDLLENTYLCGSNNNKKDTVYLKVVVVICLKIRTFVVATTTQTPSSSLRTVL